MDTLSSITYLRDHLKDLTPTEKAELTALLSMARPTMSRKMLDMIPPPIRVKMLERMLEKGLTGRVRLGDLDLDPALRLKIQDVLTVGDSA